MDSGGIGISSGLLLLLMEVIHRTRGDAALPVLLRILLALP
jgi:hypothetical protein